MDDGWRYNERDATGNQPVGLGNDGNARKVVVKVVGESCDRFGVSVRMWKKREFGARGCERRNVQGEISETRFKGSPASVETERRNGMG